MALESVVAQIKVDEERKREVTAEYEALEEACGTHAFDYATVMLEVQERAADEANSLTVVAPTGYAGKAVPAVLLSFAVTAVAA